LSSFQRRTSASSSKNIVSFSTVRDRHEINVAANLVNRPSRVLHQIGEFNVSAKIVLTFSVGDW
jgi:hypothetical protein